MARLFPNADGLDGDMERERLSSSSMRTTVLPCLLLSFFLPLRAFFIFVRSSPLNGFPSWFVRPPSISPPLRSSLLSLEWCEHHHSVCEMSFPLPAFCLPRWNINYQVTISNNSSQTQFFLALPHLLSPTLCSILFLPNPLCIIARRPRHHATLVLSLLSSLPRFLHIFPVAAKAASFATLSLGGGGGGSQVVVGSLALSGNSFHSEESGGGGSFRPYNAE